MKRSFALFALCLLLCPLLPACDAGGAEQQDFHESVLTVYVRPASESVSSNILLEWNDAQTMIALRADPEKTVEDLSNCACDYIFDIEGDVLYYHSACGTFQDKENSISYEMSDEQTALINEIIERTVN